MPDQNERTEAKAPAAKPVGGGGTTTGPAPRRSPGHRGMDAREAMAEMAARAQEISLEAGSKVGTALKDVINAAAGIAGFAVESARDVVQYMVRRGQMTQDEADKLIRAAEEAHVKHGGVRPAPAPRAEPQRPAPHTPAFAPPLGATPAAGVSVVAGARAATTGAPTIPATARPAMRTPAVAAPAVRPVATGALKTAPKGAAKVGTVAKPSSQSKAAKPSKALKPAKAPGPAKASKSAKSLKTSKPSRPAKPTVKKKATKKR